MKLLVFSHIGLAYFSLILLLIRGVLSARQVDWRQYKLLKIAPHLIDTLLLITGAVIWAFFSFTLQPWLIAKFLFLVLYILWAIKAFKKTAPFSLKYFILSVISFMLTMIIATVK